MGQYTLDSRHAGVVALDQHARSVALCGIRLDTAEVRSTRLVGCPSASDISGWALAWVGAPVRFVYESGPCGFQLARDLRGAGLDCDVIAVSSIPRSASDRAFKDDRRDARALLEAVVAPSSRCRAVYVPSEEAEAARDMVRAHRDASAATRRLKQQLSAMLLRHGHVWDERTASGALRKTWTRDYVAWVGSIELPERDEREALGFYLASTLDWIGRTGELRRRCLEIAGRDRFRPYVDALCRLKGVDEMCALAFVATVDDFSRFRNGRSVRSYFGLVPSRHDSGERTGRNGGITKAGDATVRRAVVEGLSSLTNHRGARKAAPGEGHGVSAAVEAEAVRCNERNQRRFGDLVARGKGVNVAKVAVASEVVSEMWALGRMVDRELGRA